MQEIWSFRGKRPQKERGFSVVEVLIAAGILLFILLGLLPIFTRSAMSNSSGNQYTQLTNAAKSELERLIDLPLDNTEVTVPAGVTERVITTYYSGISKTWVDTTKLGSEEPVWNRKVTVRQCDLAGFINGRCATLQPGGVVPPAQLRQIDIEVSPGRTGTSTALALLGLTKKVTLSSIKVF
ncbi:MAG TPA: hypothetical protein VGS22_06185 [Thermoanaerobaculia bacterium]|nr:hypothetical protein [Thermoanaerobaculia bacterium]